MKPEPDKLPVYILAGGQSSRFGSNKARAMKGGRPLVVALAETMAPVASTVTVVAARPGQYDDLGLRTIADRAPGLGPLAGLDAALNDLEQPGWLALVACDWAGVCPEWIRLLQRAIAPGVHCVLFGQPHLEPLFGLYHTALAPRVQQHLASGRRAMKALVCAAPCRSLPAPPGWSAAVNINHPGDLPSLLERKS